MKIIYLKESKRLSPSLTGNDNQGDEEMTDSQMVKATGKLVGVVGCLKGQGSILISGLLVARCVVVNMGGKFTVGSRVISVGLEGSSQGVEYQHRFGQLVGQDAIHRSRRITTGTHPGTKRDIYLYISENN